MIHRKIPRPENAGLPTLTASLLAAAGAVLAASLLARVRTDDVHRDERIS